MKYTGTIIEIKSSKSYLLTNTLQTIAIPFEQSHALGKQISIEENLLRTSVQPQGKKSNKSLFLYMAVSAAALLLLVTSVWLAGTLLRNGNTPKLADSLVAVVLSLDINPSLEFETNIDKQVLSITAANREGEEVLAALGDYYGEDIKVVLEKAIAAADSLGYVTNRQVIMISAGYSLEDAQYYQSGYEEELSELLKNLDNSTGATLFTMVVNDPSYLKSARENGLSLNKEIIYTYSKTQGVSLSLDDMIQSSVADLLNKLNMGTQEDPAPTEEEDVASATTDTITSGDDASTTGDTTAEETADDASEDVATDGEADDDIAEDVSEEDVIEEETDEDTAEEEDSTPSTPSYEPAMSAAVTGNTLAVYWAPVAGNSVTYNGFTYSEFKYYKVVASASNPNPMYPNDGYLGVLSSYSDSSWSTDITGSDYNKPILESGKTYYVAITYVFKNGSFSSSNVATVTMPTYQSSTETTTTPSNTSTGSSSTISPSMSASMSGNTLSVSWATLPSDTVVYNGNTYCFSNGKFTASNVATVTIP